VFVAGTLLSVGDLLAQFAIERRSLAAYEPKRTLRFAVFGTFFAVSQRIDVSTERLK